MDPLGALIGKALGALGGAFLALVFIPPRGVREFLARGSGSIVAGIIAAPVVLGHFGWPADLESMMAAAAAAAFAAWPIMGLFTALVRARQRREDQGPDLPP